MKILIECKYYTYVVLAFAMISSRKQRNTTPLSLFFYRSTSRQRASTVRITQESTFVKSKCMQNWPYRRHQILKYFVRSNHIGSNATSIYLLDWRFTGACGTERGHCALDNHRGCSHNDNQRVTGNIVVLIAVEFFYRIHSQTCQIWIHVVRSIRKWTPFNSIPFNIYKANSSFI